MTSAVASALAGVVFGIALAAPPGPMNAIIAEESVIRGWTAGAAAGLGAMSADAAFFVLTLLGVVDVVGAVPTLRAGMVGIGGGLMLYFAYGAASNASESFTTGELADGSGHATGFRKAFVLALSNPYQIVFWLTVGVGMLRPGRLDVLSYTPYVGDSLSGLLVVTTGSPALIVGFFAGIGIWVVGFPAVLVALGRRVEEFSTGVAVASAVVLGGFGVVFLADAARTFT